MSEIKEIINSKRLRIELLSKDGDEVIEKIDNRKFIFLLSTGLFLCSSSILFVFIEFTLLNLQPYFINSFTIIFIIGITSLIWSIFLRNSTTQFFFKKKTNTFAVIQKKIAFSKENNYNLEDIKVFVRVPKLFVYSDKWEKEKKRKYPCRIFILHKNNKMSRITSFPRQVDQLNLNDLFNQKLAQITKDTEVFSISEKIHRKIPSLIKRFQKAEWFSISLIWLQFIYWYVASFIGTYLLDIKHNPLRKYYYYPIAGGLYILFIILLLRYAINYKKNYYLEITKIGKNFSSNL